MTDEHNEELYENITEDEELDNAELPEEESPTEENAETREEEEVLEEEEEEEEDAEAKARKDRAAFIAMRQRNVATKREIARLKEENDALRRGEVPVKKEPVEAKGQKPQDYYNNLSAAYNELELEYMEEVPDYEETAVAYVDMLSKRNFEMMVADFDDTLTFSQKSQFRKQAKEAAAKSILDGAMNAYLSGHNPVEYVHKKAKKALSKNPAAKKDNVKQRLQNLSKNRKKSANMAGGGSSTVVTKDAKWYAKKGSPSDLMNLSDEEILAMTL